MDFPVEMGTRETLEGILPLVGRWEGSGTWTKGSHREPVSATCAFYDRGLPYLIMELRTKRESGRLVEAMYAFVSCPTASSVRLTLALAADYVGLSEGELVPFSSVGFEARLVTDIWSHPEADPVDATEMVLNLKEGVLTQRFDVLLSNGGLIRSSLKLTPAA